jgi:hypothetical protein
VTFSCGDADEVELSELLRGQGGDFDATIDYLFDDKSGPNVQRGVDAQVQGLVSLRACA